MLFSGARDTELRAITGSFPKSIKGPKSSHPIFILQSLGNFGFRVCPCSSKRHRGRYIKKGCVLDETDIVTDRDSFLIEEYSFALSSNSPVESKLRFMGKVPEKCLGNQK